MLQDKSHILLQKHNFVSHRNLEEKSTTVLKSQSLIQDMFISAFSGKKKLPQPCNYILKLSGKGLFTECERHTSQATVQKESRIVITNCNTII